MKQALAILGCCLLPVDGIRSQDAVKDTRIWSFKGRVVDPQGNAIADAGLTAGPHDQYVTVDALEHPIAKTAADGKFVIDVRPLPESSSSILTILVAAPGRASAIWQINSEPSAGPVDLGDIVLPKGTTHHGRVRGRDGKPLAGARVVSFDLIASRTWYYANSSVIFTSTATTAVDGIFTLPCALPEAVEILVRAEGHASRRLSPVSQGQPLDIQLAESGFVEGTLKGPDGKPEPGGLYVEYEVAPDERQMLQADASGRFRMTLRHSGRYRLSAWIPDHWEAGNSPVLDGPARGVEVRLQPPGKELILHAVDASTGAAIKAFRVLSWSLRYGDGGVSDDLLGDWSGESDSHGKWRLPVGLDGRSGTGPLSVSVEGYAPLTIAEVDIDKEGQILVEARLDKESVVEGKVVDETGKPLVGVALTCRAGDAEREERRRARRRNRGPGLRTAEDGTFRVGSLGKGTYEIQVGDASTPGGKTATVVLADGETRKAVVLKSPQCAAIAGRILGVPVGPGWKLRLLPGDRPVDPYESWYEPSEAMNEVRLDGSGSFRFEKKLPGSYQLHMVIPGPPRTGLQMVLPLETLPIDGADLTSNIDPARHMPATLHGKVSFKGASLQAGRFVVNAIPIVHSNLSWWTSLPVDALLGRYALVAADGSYELNISPVEHHLQVVDIETGVVLHKEERPLRARGDKVMQKDFVLAVVPITVSFEPAAKGRFLAARLAIQAAVEPVTEMGNISIEIKRQGTGAGLNLADGASEVSFFVPTGQLKLTVYSMANRLDRGPNRRYDPVSLGEAELTAAIDKAVLVSIKVADPPAIEDAGK